MAGKSSKAIKNRIKSMESTRQITKAMELVASSKLSAAQQKALATRPYFQVLYDAMSSIARLTHSFESAYLETKNEGRDVFIVFAGDRGLAAGYNSNVLRMAEEKMNELGGNCVVIPVGKKSMEFFKKKSFEIISEDFLEIGKLQLTDCVTMARTLAEGFLNGSVKSARLYYTNFTSMLSQTPREVELLPLKLDTMEKGKEPDILFENSSEETFNIIVPEYLSGVLYGALHESVASEQAARRMAMESATKNADDIISQLNLSYNQARQAAITQELTEIVAGAEA